MCLYVLSFMCRSMSFQFALLFLYIFTKHVEIAMFFVFFFLLLLFWAVLVAYYWDVCFVKKFFRFLKEFIFKKQSSSDFWDLYFWNESRKKFKCLIIRICKYKESVKTDSHKRMSKKVFLHTHQSFDVKLKSSLWVCIDLLELLMSVLA